MCKQMSSGSFKIVTLKQSLTNYDIDDRTWFSITLPISVNMPKINRTNAILIMIVITIIIILLFLSKYYYYYLLL